MPSTHPEISRRLLESTTRLVEALINDLDDRSGFSVDDDVRKILRSDWHELLTTHLTCRDEIHALVIAPNFERPVAFPRPIVCAWCGNKHRSIYPEDPLDRNTQGDACAARCFQVTEDVISRLQTPGYAPDPAPNLRVGEWLVQGHYGSSDYDCMLLRFVANMPTAPADPICDNCIGERLRVDDLRRIEGEFPW